MEIDPIIKQKAEDIRNKIYGKEVRESLASGIEAMSEDVVSVTGRQATVEEQFQSVLDETTGKDVISAPEIILARNGEADLKARLDKEHQEVNAQLAQIENTKASINYVDAVLMDIAKGGPNNGPQGPFMSLAALYSYNFPDGKEGTWLVFDSSFTDGAHSFMWDSFNSSWKDLGVYQASLIAYKSVKNVHLSDELQSNLLEFKLFNSPIKNGFYSTYDKVFHANADYMTVTAPTIGEEVFSCDTKITDSTVAVVMFFLDEACTQYLSHIGGGLIGTQEKYRFSTPTKARGVAVSSKKEYQPVLRKGSVVNIAAGFSEIERNMSYLKVADSQKLNGFYSTIDNNFYENADYETVKYVPAVGEKVFITAKTDTNTLATCVFWNSLDGKIQTIKGGQIGDYYDLEVIVPVGTAYMTVTSKKPTSPIIKKQNILVAEEVYHKINNAESKPFMWVRKTTDKLEVLSKYDVLNDLKMTFGKVSTNQTWQISNFYLLPNETPTVSSDFDRISEPYMNVFTDYTSPFGQLNAINNIDGDSPDSDHYTGGWHGYDNANTGSRTARTSSIKVFVDGYSMMDNQVIQGYEVKLVVINFIQGTNTKKVDGTGREILREKVTYTIIGGKISVDVELTALENLTLSQYYFLQFQIVSKFEGKFLPVDDGEKNKWITDYATNRDGASSSNSNCNEIIMEGSTDKCVMWYDNDFDLGRRVKDNARKNWHYRNYKKIYFDLIDKPSTAPLMLEQNEILFARGGYEFSRL